MANLELDDATSGLKANMNEKQVSFFIIINLHVMNFLCLFVFQVMHSHHFEGAVGNSITGSSAPLTSRRVNEIRADASSLGRSA